MKEPFYLTTTLPYVNATPHIGFALELAQADAVARLNVLRGREVVFNMGVDEHGMKIHRKAVQEGKDPQAYVDEYAPKFEALRAALDVGWTRFIRTTDPAHMAAAQEFWRRCEAAGDIYKKQYAVKYCVGCELEKTDSELEGGRCPLHPNREVELIEEENWFFRYSRYQERLLALYDARPDFVVPASRLGEIRSFVAGGLNDFSISRRKDKMPWGVPVPGEEDHVMYVWFDALVNYISTLGWPDEAGDYARFWPGVQVAGKDNLRPQAAMWQAMLMSAGLPASRQIFIHGFITSGGQKMSKSVGNVIDPYEAVRRYGTDATRWFLLGQIHPTEDSDFTWERFGAAYAAHLAHGLGNFAARVLAMAAKAGVRLAPAPVPEAFWQEDPRAAAMAAHLDAFRFNDAVALVEEEVRTGDRFVQETEPFRTIATDPDKAKADLLTLLERLGAVGCLLAPLMPNTSAAILGALAAGTTLPAPLFPKVEQQPAAPAAAGPRPVRLVVDPEVAAKGIKARMAVLTVPEVRNKQGGELKAHIAETLATLDVEKALASPVLGEYRRFYEELGLEGLVPPAQHLLEIVRRTGTIPNISNVVDAYNVVSVATGLSIGAHDLDAIKGDVRFALTTGDERYVPLGQTEHMKVLPGEYACRDDEKVICRMDVKQCDETRIRKGVTRFVVYVQGNRETTDDDVLVALRQVCANVEAYCGGTYEIL